MHLIPALFVLALRGQKAGRGKVDVACASASAKIMAEMTAYKTYIVCI